MAIVMCGAVLEPRKLENHFYHDSSYIVAVLHLARNPRSSSRSVITRTPRSSLPPSFLPQVCLATIILCCTCFEAMHSGTDLGLFHEERRVRKPLRVGLQVAFAIAIVLVPVLKEDCDKDPISFLAITLGLYAASVGTAFWCQGTLLFKEVHPVDEGGVEGH